MAQAVIRSLAVNAAKGNQRAQRLFTQLLASIERDNKQLHDEWLETAINYKVEWEKELERRKRNDIVAPDPVPHPDHVVIDMSTGTVRITGAMTKEEKVAWDLLITSNNATALDLKDAIKRDPADAINRLDVFQSSPPEPGLERIERVIVYPKEEQADD